MNLVISFLIITVFYFIVIGIQTKLYKDKEKKLDKKFEVVNKKVTFNLAHAEAIEATIGAELTKRVELLKTMNYHDWIQYNQKKYYHHFSKRNISYSSLEKGSKL